MAGSEDLVYHVRVQLPEPLQKEPADHRFVAPWLHRLISANAGHNPPCCLDRSGVTDLWATGMPLRLMPGMDYEEKETVLMPEDGVLFYSDGLVEAHNPQREMLGSSRLRNLMADKVPGAGRLTAKVIEELERFTGEDWEQEDDLTLVALQRLATGVRSSSCSQSSPVNRSSSSITFAVRRPAPGTLSAIRLRRRDEPNISRCGL